jgi:hypothetical protein
LLKGKKLEIALKIANPDLYIPPDKRHC